MTGSSGVGKTVLARQLATRLGLEHVEVDGLFHGPGWTPTPPAELRAKIEARLVGGAWVIDGNYESKVGDLMARLADLRIALDLPVPLMMARVVRRTLRRTLTRQELWNGNREPWSNLTRWGADENIIRWSWVHRAEHRRRARTAERDGRAGGLPCVRLTSPAQVRRFVRYLGA